MNTDAEHMRSLAIAFENADDVSIHNNQAVHGRRISDNARVWVAAGLRLLAEKVDRESEKPVDTPPAAG